MKKQMRAALWLRRLVTGLSPQRPRFNHSQVHVGFLVNIVTLDRFFFEYSSFPLSVSFHQCSILMFLSSVTNSI
jgi:hypothetical protein